MRTASAIRPATDREVPLAVDVLRRAGFGTQVARLLEYPRRSPNGAVLVAEGPGGAVVGVACCAAFATSLKCARMPRRLASIWASGSCTG